MLYNWGLDYIAFNMAMVEVLAMLKVTRTVRLVIGIRSLYAHAVSTAKSFWRIVSATYKSSNHCLPRDEKNVPAYGNRLTVFHPIFYSNSNTLRGRSSVYTFDLIERTFSLSLLRDRCRISESCRAELSHPGRACTSLCATSASRLTRVYPGPSDAQVIPPPGR